MILRSWGAIALLMWGSSVVLAQAPAVAPADYNPVTSSGALPDYIMSNHDWSGYDPVGGPALWADAELLMWWLRGAPLPPLVTQGSPTDTNPGALGQPGTSVLYGGKPQDFGPFEGLRITLGGQIADSGLGLEGSGMLLEHRTQIFTAASNANGQPLLANPLFFSDLGQEGSFLISGQVPAPIVGNTTIASSLHLWGTEVHPILNLWQGQSLRVDGFVGFRYLDLEEDLRIATFANDIANDIQQLSVDGFHTRNQFYGADLGAKVRWCSDRLSMDLGARVALGATHQVVNVDGITTASGAGAFLVGTYPAGIYAQPTNIGRQENDHFSVIPQVQLKASYAVLRNLQVFVGWDYLYWSSVVRPGDQIDRAVNSNLLSFPGQPLVGPANPQPLFQRTAFWAQGVTFGVELQF